MLGRGKDLRPKKGVHSPPVTCYDPKVTQAKKNAPLFSIGRESREKALLSRKETPGVGSYQTQTAF